MRQHKYQNTTRRGQTHIKFQINFLKFVKEYVYFLWWLFSKGNNLKCVRNAFLTRYKKLYLTSVYMLI